MPNKKRKSLLDKRMTYSVPQVALFVVAFAIIGCVAMIKSFAAPGGKNGGTSSISVKMVTDANADNLPNYGDTITFDVSTAATKRPDVQLNCTQNGQTVYYKVVGFYPEYLWAKTYQLSSFSDHTWASGGATCTAYLQYNSSKRIITLTTLNFQVNP